MSGKKAHKLVVDEYYVRPQAAWELMKAAQNSRQTAYIYGATGTGKTSLIADFIDKKQYRYINLSDTETGGIDQVVAEKTDTAHEKGNALSIFVIDGLHLLGTLEERNDWGELIEELSLQSKQRSGKASIRECWQLWQKSRI
ncbi:MAG: AAA family ATPase [Suilimivivens sp.]